MTKCWRKHCIIYVARLIWNLWFRGLVVNRIVCKFDIFMYVQWWSDTEWSLCRHLLHLGESQRWTRGWHISDCQASSLLSTTDCARFCKLRLGWHYGIIRKFISIWIQLGEIYCVAYWFDVIESLYVKGFIQIMLYILIVQAYSSQCNGQYNVQLTIYITTIYRGS